LLATKHVLGVVFFVMNLKKGHYKFQFLQFFWTHMTLLVVVFQSQLIISNTLEGLIWFILPAFLVIINDVFAYVGGFFFGRTRLIKISPKKTWEGFIFGFICTLLFAVVMTGTLVQFPYLTCPLKDLTLSAWDKIECQPDPVFVPIKYKLSPALASLARHIVSVLLYV
jgi:phosphatidate cytidylyltransferase